MSKTKKWLAFLASLTMVATLGVATACGDKGGSDDNTGSSPIETVPGDTTPGDSTPDDTTPTKKTYTVTVLKPDGTPAANLPLNFCIGEECTPITTDANGVATFETENLTAVYHVEFKMPLDSLYESYGFGYTELNTNPDQLTYTMNLTPLKTEPAAPVISEPLSGTGVYDDAYVIEAGKTYCASAEQQAENFGDVYYTLTASENGTYTVDLPDEYTGNLSASVEGVLTAIEDGSSFSVKAGNAVVFLTYCQQMGTEENNWQNTYSDVIFSLSFDNTTYAESGSQLAPFTLISGTTYEVEPNAPIYYEFTAPSNGQYKLTLNDWENVSENVNFFTPDWDSFDRGVATDIAENETLLLMASNSTDATASWTFTFGTTLENDENCDTEIAPDPLGSKNNAHCIAAPGEAQITVAAGASYYMSLDAAYLAFVVPEDFTAMSIAGMDRRQYAAGEWIVFDNYHSLMAQYMQVVLTNNTEADATLTLNIITKPAEPEADGSMEYPYVLVEGDNTITTDYDNGVYVIFKTNGVAGTLSLTNINAYIEEMTITSENVYEYIDGITTDGVDSNIECTNANNIICLKVFLLNEGDPNATFTLTFTPAA